MTLWEKIAALSGEVVKEQGLASVDQPMSNDLFRFLHYLQEKVEAEECEPSIISSPAERGRTEALEFYRQRP